MYICIVDVVLFGILGETEVTAGRVVCDVSQEDLRALSINCGGDVGKYHSM